MLTISQLARYVGVTARTVRHYHASGLLPEPERDRSGYRRYGAQAVTDLIQITTLARAGVPLARIRALLVASPPRFAEAVGEIDAALADRIGRLEETRRRLGRLQAGDRLSLPDDVATLLERLRGLGISERTLALERDGWILMVALHPGRVPGWVRQKNALLDDDDVVHLYRRLDRAAGWSSDDSRLPALARETTTALRPHHDPAPQIFPGERRVGSAAALATHPLVSSYIDRLPPAWARLDQLVHEAQGRA